MSRSELQGLLERLEGLARIADDISRVCDANVEAYGRGLMRGQANGLRQAIRVVREELENKVAA